MRYQDKGVFIIVQIPFQPFDMFCVQIVGRLVQEKDIGFLQEQLAKQNLGALPAA